MGEKNSSISETFVNPLVRKLKKNKSEVKTAATYGGIFKKCVFFMLMVAIGVGVSIALHQLPVRVGGDIALDIGVAEMYAAIIALVAIIVCPIIAIFVRKLTPIFGTISCICVGYIVAFVATLVPEYSAVVYMALLITFLLVITMMVLFATGIIKVNKVFMSILSTSVIVFLVTALAFLVLYLIPQTRFIYEFAANNFGLSIVFAVFGIFLASAFLVMDFKVVQDTVNSGVDKSNEWYVAYSLSFTMIWLYFEVLNLLTLVDKS